MKRISLSEFAAERGQTKAAELLGITQGALSKALRVGREIYVVCLDDGTCEAHELKPFPTQAPKTMAMEGAPQQPTAQSATRARCLRASA
ncbi:hypothetical protein M2318_004873 [Metapseudomonas resinovorans]|uniref:Cro/CI family transcriptional regulator n=1 Tax=Metapseudomonas resinovorans TaxID=53412 RepID=UPI003D1FB3BC